MQFWAYIFMEDLGRVVEDKRHFAYRKQRDLLSGKFFKIENKGPLKVSEMTRDT